MVCLTKPTVNNSNNFNAHIYKQNPRTNERIETINYNVKNKFMWHLDCCLRRLMCLCITYVCSSLNFYSSNLSPDSLSLSFIVCLLLLFFLFLIRFSKVFLSLNFCLCNQFIWLNPKWKQQHFEQDFHIWIFILNSLIALFEMGDLFCVFVHTVTASQFIRYQSFYFCIWQPKDRDRKRMSPFVCICNLIKVFSFFLFASTAKWNSDNTKMDRIFSFLFFFRFSELIHIIVQWSDACVLCT